MPNIQADPTLSTIKPAKLMPTAWPRKRHEANQPTALPRALATIWVALVCKVACSR
jgi:hypothetical protein